MSAVRSRRVFGPTVLGTANSTLYTVPSDRTLLIRPGGIRAVNYSGSTRNFFLYINGSTDPFSMVRLFGVLTDTAYIDAGFWILNPGDTITGKASAASSINVSGFGSLLDGAPS